MTNLRATVTLLCLSLAVVRAEEEKEETFQLWWVCLIANVVATVILVYIAWRRPEEMKIPGSSVMSVKETDKGIAPDADLNDDEISQLQSNIYMEKSEA
ncbi:hypothetical protein ADEAN_000137100 [Angomonas deanei]|uniref:Uncharacterized protein n=1 Tax=Angomonas deanei TaxID=59799 RepID=A0A7G2C588_9TRYP|nr:hypothetical protein ADEAN_000137100 [Angomonas deanei]